MQKSVILVANNVAVPSAQYAGGRTVISIQATTYGTAQLQAMGPNGGWFNVGAASTADGFSATVDLPPGSYRMNVSGQAGMNASLLSIPSS